MKQFILTAVLLTTLVGQQALADRPVAQLGLPPGSGATLYFQPATDRVLTSDSTYHLGGVYVVDSLKTITIPAGTVIIGDSAATILIHRGGMIFALGTQDNPIVMTSDEPAGARAAGDWGGVIILGKAPTNQANPSIEGIVQSFHFGGGGIGLGDPNDNSGTFKYVRIEFAGYRFQINNEINGLTLGGVGKGTEINHVQVSYPFDDGVECFGGTVDMNHMVMFGVWDDMFDTDFGYQGRLQFGFGLSDPANSELNGVGQSNGFESDNEGTSSSVSPRTQPRYSNFTLIGPRRTDAIGVPPAPRQFEYAAVVRRGSELSLYNSVLMGFRGGYSLRDVDCFNAANSGDLQVRNVSLQKDSAVTAVTPLNTLHVSGGSFGVTSFWNTGGWGNMGATDSLFRRAPSSIGLVNMSDLTNPDPRPGIGSEPATAGVEFTNLNVLAGGYFIPTTYRGAFDPALPMNQQWTARWTNFDPQNFDINGMTSDVELTDNGLPEDFALLQNYPNPFNPATEIRFSLPSGSFIRLEVYNLLGELVTTLVNEDKPAGNYTVRFDASGLPSGVYLYRLSAKGVSQTRRMILLK